MDQRVQASFDFGRTRADLVVGRRVAEVSLAAAAAVPFGGFLIAEGDSWFNYPIFDEITEKLEDDHNYRIESAARWGDTAENILFTEGGDGKKLVKTFEKLKRDNRVPRAILLSCGGNDLAGDQFIVLLNHRQSPTPGLNIPIVTEVFARLKDTIGAVVGLLKGIGTRIFGVDLPVILHGYGHAVPDGRGFLNTSLFSGPWLAPAFEQKGYTSLPERVLIMANLIDRFNALQQEIAANIPAVGFVDARPVLSNDLQNDRYRDDWSNELHPTGDGFANVAALFDVEIKKFPMP
jgi:hypothetical protein